MTLPTKIDVAIRLSLPECAEGVERLRPGGEVLKRHFPNLVVSKQKLRRADTIACVRLKHEEAKQNLVFASRPFVLCGLPVKRPQSGQLLHERLNGNFLLQVTGHPHLSGHPRHSSTEPSDPVSQRSRNAGHVRMQQGGTQYRRLVAAFQRIFEATIFFGTDSQREKAMVVHHARFSFMSEARIWYSRHSGQETLPCEFQNEIVLSDEFFKEILAHPIPTDMEAAKTLSCSPAALDLFTWLSYRCFVAKGRERVPFFGEIGFVSQLGSADYSRPPRTGTKPSWYLVTTEDKMIPPDAQRVMSKRAGSTVVEVKSSHAVYVSHPQVVTHLIEQAATGALATAKEKP